MPWFADGDDPAVVNSQLNRKVSKWPKSNSNRVDARFRHTYGEGLPYPRSCRSLFRFAPLGLPPGPIHNCWFDLSVLSDTQLNGSSGLGPDGWDIELTVTNFIAPFFDPEFGLEGIEYRWTIHFVGAEDWQYVWMRPHNFPPPTPPVPYQYNVGFSWPGMLFLTVLKGGFPHPEWTAPPQQSIQTWTLSQCWEFPEEEGGFAEFNDVDAWISYPADMPYSTPQMKVEFDIRPKETGEQMVVTGLQRFTSFATMFVGLDTLQWWNRVVALSPGLVMGIWQKVRIEYNWSVPGLAYSLWIDDVFQGSSTVSFTISPWDEMGRRGNTIEGLFDLKNFKEWGGSPGTPVLRIDVPLELDACPVIPLANKGTTFNMDLPSCP